MVDEKAAADTLFASIRSGRADDALSFFNTIRGTKHSYNQETLDQGLILACKHGRLFIVQILIFHGANIETRDKDGNTPLLICAEKGFTDIALLLVDKGADINSCNKDGDTALLLSITTSRSSELVRKLLEKLNLNVDHKNKKEFSALDKAIEVLNLPLTRELLEYQAYSKNKGDVDLRKIVMHILENESSATKLADSLGLTPFTDILIEHIDTCKTVLQCAVLRKDTYVIQLLLACRDVKFNNEDVQDYEIISKFLNKTLEHEIEILDQHLAVIKMLISGGAPVNYFGSYVCLESPLTLAVRLGSYELIKILCLNGADVTESENYKKNKIPWDVVTENSRYDIINLLFLFGAKVTDEFHLALISAIEQGQIDFDKLKLELKIDFEKLKLELKSNITMESASNSSQVSTSNEVCQPTANASAKQYHILHMIEQAAQSGSPKEMLECFNQLIHKDNKFDQESLDQGLLLSCRYGREFMVHILIAHGANIETRDEDGNTPLLICAEKGFTDIALLLVDKGADINSYNKDGDTVLLFSIKTSGSSKLVKKVLEKQDLNVCHMNKQKYSAMKKAVEALNLKLIKMLLEHQNNVNDPTTIVITEDVSIRLLLFFFIKELNNDDTALRIAVSEKKMDVLQLLLACGVVDFTAGLEKDYNIILDILKSILHLKATISDIDFETIKILIKVGAPLNYYIFCNGYPESPLATAVRIGCYDLIEMICLHQADLSEWIIPWDVLVQEGRCDIMTLLFKHGANVNAGDCEALLLSIMHEKMDCAKLLVNFGAKLDVKRALQDIVINNRIKFFWFLNEHFHTDFCSLIQIKGTQILRYAANKKQTELIKLLVKAGADINGNKYHKTPLMSTTDPSVMEFLIKLGADVNTLCENDIISYSALELAINECTKGNRKQNLLERVTVLLNNNAKVNVEDFIGNTPLMNASKISDTQDVIRALLQAGSKINKQNKEGETALHLAVYCDSISNAVALLGFKPDIELKNRSGQTPLSYAVQNARTQIIHVLIDCNANVKCQDNNGNTPLHSACSLTSYDRFQIIKMLIKQESCVNQTNNEGYTPLMVAAKQQPFEVIRLLYESGADINFVNKKKHETAFSILLNNTGGYVKKTLLYFIEKGAESSYINPGVMHRYILVNAADCLKNIIDLGFGPEDVSSDCFGINYLIFERVSPLLLALLYGNIDIARFLNDIWFLTPSDVSSLASNETLRKSLENNKLSECLEFLDEYSSQPMSLQKLSFVVVSSAVGADAGRKERVQQLPIPNTFKDKLLFKHAHQVHLEDEDDSLTEESLSLDTSNYLYLYNHRDLSSNYLYRRSYENQDSDYNYLSDDQPTNN